MHCRAGSSSWNMTTPGTSRAAWMKSPRAGTATARSLPRWTSAWTKSWAGSRPSPSTSCPHRLARNVAHRCASARGKTDCSGAVVAIRRAVSPHLTTRGSLSWMLPAMARRTIPARNAARATCNGARPVEKTKVGSGVAAVIRPATTRYRITGENPAHASAHRHQPANTRRGHPAQNVARAP